MGHLAAMHRMLSPGGHAQRMRGSHRRHNDDREHGKQGDETGHHGTKIDIAHENVHCRGRIATGRPTPSRETNETLPKSWMVVLKRILRARFVSVALAGGLVGAFLAGWHYAGTEVGAVVSAEAIMQGRQLYEDHCAACHGISLEGQQNWQSPGPDGRLPAPPHDETGHTWHHPDQVLFQYTKLGGRAALALQGVEFDSGMPAFGGLLTDKDIWSTLRYIQSTWPERVRTVQARRTGADLDNGNE